VQMLAEAPCGFFRALLGCVRHCIDGDVSIALLQGGIQGLHDALWFCRSEAEAVLDHMKHTELLRFGGALALAFGGSLRRRTQACFFMMDTGVALLVEKAAYFFFGIVGGDDYRKGNDQARIFGTDPRRQLLLYGFWVVPLHARAAALAIQAPQAGV